MSDDYIVNSYTTFTTQFNATLIQAEPIILSDIFEVSIDFAWTTPELEKGNAAFLKIKFFIEELLHHSILTHPTAPIDMDFADNNIVLFPYIPTNDVIAITLHAKFNAIADGNLEVLSVRVGSKVSTPSIRYTYAEPEYPMLPDMKTFIGEGRHFYPVPWWFRPSTDFYDFLADEDDDLTNPPPSDNIFEDIDKIVTGEMGVPKNGEIIEIPKWKPQIIKD
jgi:hypothetical protein